MKFEINKKYSCRSICDSNCTWTFTVVKRTASFITLANEKGETFRKKVIVFDGDEQCTPLGSYSMAPILRADMKVRGELEVQEVQEVQEAKSAKDATKSEEVNEPHYVVQHSKETKKIGIFPSYETALKWVNENSEKYKGELGIYRVGTYDQELKVKSFELIGGSFKEVGSFSEGQTITETETEGCKANVKYRGGNRILQGEYKETDTDSKKKSADILIKYANGGSFTVSVKPHVIVKGRGVKDRYDSGNYEVSSNKLKQLQETYSSMCDF